jgi:U3 small nucleolar RNA-associated protein 14
MDALLSALDESSSLTGVKHKLSELEKSMNKGSKSSKGVNQGSKAVSDMSVPIYVNKVVADRIERNVAYDKNKDEMNKWSTVVNENRALKTLDLAQDKRQSTSYRTLLKKYTPVNEMEKEVQMALYDTGTDDKAALQKEDDDLGHRHTDINELRQKQADLAKVKALLFYEQMKRHRLNKIKSKAYHRIKKRQRLHKDADKNVEGDLDQEESNEHENKEALKRVEERMNLRHKNMGKWARMALEHSHTNKGLRDSYHDAVRLGNELSTKVHEINEDEDSGDDDYDSTGENSILLSATNAVLDGYRETNTSVQGKYKKLFDMDFMKKAVIEQRKRGLEEAKNVLREIEDMENDIDSDSHDNEIQNQNQKPVQIALDMSKKKKDGSMLIGKSQIKTSYSISNNAIEFNENDNQTEHSRIEEENSVENPWLSINPDIDKKNKRNQIKSKIKSDFIKFSQPSQIQGETKSREKKQANENNKISRINKDGENPTEEPPVHDDIEKIVKLKKLFDDKSTSDMVNLAFAGPDYEADFKSSKKNAIEQELGLDEKKIQILSQVKVGWGDWAGPGNNGISKRTIAKRDILLKQIEKDVDIKRKRRQDSKIMNVIISDRRIKTSSKFKISEVPHPFTSIEEYEQSLQVPIGSEWNSSQVVKKNTNPDIITRSGRVIEAIKLK